MVGVAIGLAVIACLVAASAVVVLFSVRKHLQEAYDILRVLQVTIYGLDAKLMPEIVSARDSADATVAGIEELKKMFPGVTITAKQAHGTRSPFEGFSPFGRAAAVRELMAQAEAESLEAVRKQNG